MKKFFCITLILLLTVGIFAGCTSESKPARTESVPATTDQKTTETKAAETEAQSEPATTDAPVPVETDAPITTQAAETTEPVTEPATTESSPVPSGESSELLKDYDWTDGVIVIDGVLYQSFYDPYSKFPENGWDFEFGDRTVKETDTLNAHTYVIGGVRLHNDKYPGSSEYSRPDIYVAFYNSTDENLPYKSCNILGIEVEGTSGYETWENQSSNPCESYDFEIPRGIRRGASMEEVKAAYGEPDDVYVAEGHYEVLTYEADHLEYKLTVYYDTGLQGVDINDSRQWLH